MPEFRGQQYDDRYTLVARLGNRIKTAVVYGDPHALDRAGLADEGTAQELADTDATVTASIRVMDLASDSEVWAKGQIELKQKGRILKVMEAKS